MARSCSLALILVAAGSALLLNVGCSTDESETTTDPESDPSATESSHRAEESPVGRQNGDETDIDCGGTSAPKCADGKKCIVGSDCENASCKEGTCRPPAPDDGVKNGDETDIDCGGSNAPQCGVGKGCKVLADCASDACAYDGKCVEFKSCTGHFGGDTCGAGETGTSEAKHESCCTNVAINDRPAGAFKMDKYQITAGRMRAFVERWGGNLQAWAAGKPKGWNDAWTTRLPQNLEDAHFLLGPGNKRGCSVPGQGARTYWQDIAGPEKSDFSKDVLDEKTLQCVPWHMVQALCVSDGGRLATNDEIRWVFENRGSGTPTTYPWQFQDTSPYDPAVQDERLVHQYSYWTPNPPPTMRLVGEGNDAYPLDHAFYIAPPGRRPSGANKDGIQDLAGNVLSWVSDSEKAFTYTMSWEAHGKSLTIETWNREDGPDGYYGIGARCARDP